MCVNASERARRGGLQGACEGDSPVSLWLVEGVSERCFRSASLTVENHINDGGFDALIDALLPQLELLTELSLARRCFSFLSPRKRFIDRVDRPHRRADRREQAAPPGDSGPVL